MTMCPNDTILLYDPIQTRRRQSSLSIIIITHCSGASFHLFKFKNHPETPGSVQNVATDRSPRIIWSWSVRTSTLSEVMITIKIPFIHPTVMMTSQRERFINQR